MCGSGRGGHGERNKDQETLLRLESLKERQKLNVVVAVAVVQLEQVTGRRTGEYSS